MHIEVELYELNTEFIIILAHAKKFNMFVDFSPNFPKSELRKYFVFRA